MVHISSLSLTSDPRRVNRGTWVRCTALCLALGAGVAGITPGLLGPLATSRAQARTAADLVSLTSLARTSVGLLARGLPWTAGCFAHRGVESLPVCVVVPAQNIQSGGATNVTITVDQVPSSGGAVQVSCTRPDLFVSPSGTWPYTLNFPAGGSTKSTFTVSVHSTANTVPITICSCQMALDISKPTNWQAQTSATILAAQSATSITGK